MNASVLTRVLIIADQKETVSALSTRLLQEEAFDVVTASDIQSGLTKTQSDWPSLIILDLPHCSEMFDLCQVLKTDQGTRSIPIIIITAANETADRIAGLEAGADDYVGKPCNPREIVLRIKAVLRRGKRAATELQFVRGPISVDTARCQVAVNNRRVQLTAVEFKLLRALVKQPGQVQSRERLLSEARGNGELVDSRTIDTHIRRLRRKLGKAADLVETVRGAGYRLRPT